MKYSMAGQLFVVSVITTVMGASMALSAPEPAATTPVSNAPAVFQLPPLPYAQNALEPYISARTISFHYGKHHKGFVDNLKKLVAENNYKELYTQK